ncbi:hypothetical protein, partial [Rhodoferax sp.]|uniref:hypothetical protein n=1 Tax=Rhodoferax sp. TaxID=50421 RepID=UPI003BB4CF18
MSENNAIFWTNRIFNHQMPRSASPNSIGSQIARLVKESAPGTVFSPDAFALVGTRAAVDKALQ